MVPDQIIDYTWGRKSTFHEGLDEPVVHIDFTEPYDAAVRRRILAAAGAAAGEKVFDGAVYAATQGPRLETAAEINRLARDGADVGGDDRHARGRPGPELGIPYAAINVVANYAAGRPTAPSGSASTASRPCSTRRWGGPQGARASVHRHDPRRPADGRPAPAAARPAGGAFGTPELAGLLADMRDTMAALSGRAGAADRRRSAGGDLRRRRTRYRTRRRCPTRC